MFVAVSCLFSPTEVSRILHVVSPKVLGQVIFHRFESSLRGIVTRIETGLASERRVGKYEDAWIWEDLLGLAPQRSPHVGAVGWDTPDAALRHCDHPQRAAALTLR